MLKKLVIERFKSIKHAELNLGKLSVFIGTNASGKSNLFDALRVLQGIGYGMSVEEIFNGKPRTSSSLVWDGIRGGSEQAVFESNTRSIGRPTPSDARTTFVIDATYEDGGDIYFFSTKLNPSKGLVTCEAFHLNGRPLYFTAKKNGGVSHKVDVYKKKAGRPKVLEFVKSKSVIHQLNDVPDDVISGEEKKHANRFIELLSDEQRLDLLPAELREYSKTTSAERIGERGENFAAVVYTILKDPQRKVVYTNWLKLLTPSEIEEIKPLKTKLGEIRFGVREKKREVYAPSLSDGTLRFAALLAAMFQPSMPELLLLEEIENGIHPTRLKLIAELVQSRAAKSPTQIFITTHSPLLLAWLDKSQYKHVFFCYRMPDGSSQIKPLTQIPHLQKTIKKFPISELFAEGWLETVITKEEQ